MGRINYKVRFDDGQHIADTLTLEEAMQIRAEKNFNYINRSIHVYKVEGYNETKIV